MYNRITFYDVFTEIVGKGNTIGIFCDPNEDIDPESYQNLAKEYKLSEVAVIMPVDKDVDYKFRFFAPKEEIPLCGHGTIGAIAFLYE